MPFDAAKAIAATFCYKIRYALTPLFGLDFPTMCINPLDKVRFGHMIIDPAIVQKSTEMANYYRMLELRSPALSNLPDPRSHSRSTLERDGNITSVFAAKQQHFPYSHRKHTDNLSTTSTASSGCSVSPDGYNSDTYCVSPISPCRTGVTPVNAPRSTDVTYYPRTGSRTSGPSSSSNRIPSPKEILASVSARSAMPNEDNVGSGPGSGTGVGADDSIDTSSSAFSDVSSTPTDCLSLDLDDNDEDYQDAGSRNHGKNNKKVATRPSSRHGKTAILFAREVKAAHALLSLHMQEASGSESEDRAGMPVSVSLMDVHQQHRGRKRRRASA